jgi:hypothetical protein
MSGSARVRFRNQPALPRVDCGSIRQTKSGSTPMTLSLVTIQPLVALIAGILILVVPRLLNYIVAIYLIIIGITGLGLHL